MHSLESTVRWKDRRWLQQRRLSEGVQAALVNWVNANWRELGIPNPNLFFALGTWLGKPTKATSFFVMKRLGELGTPIGGPRLALLVPRGEMLGLFLWIAPLGTRETPEETTMKRALGGQNYECMTALDAASGARIISEYMRRPELHCPEA